MDTEIGVGLIVGAVAFTSIYIWNTNYFTRLQKSYLLICALFPPLQWISAFIIFFYNENSSKETVIETSKNRTNEQKERETSTNSTNEQKESLRILKISGVLEKSEYEDKLNMLDEKLIIVKVHASKEYLSLKNLYKNGLFTKEEFDKKVEILKGQVLSKDFENEELPIEKPNNEIITQDFIGRWVNENLILEFGKEKVKMVWKSPSSSSICHWEYSNNLHEIYIFFSQKKQILKIIELSKTHLIYKNNTSTFKLIKSQNE